MCFFKKKESQTTIVKASPKPCDHKYREFLWYKEMTYYSRQRSMIFSMYKPYVCIHCRNRKDVKLLEIERIDLSWEEALEVSKEYVQTYIDKLRPKAFIEEQIADFQLIDREYLKVAQQCFPDREILIDKQG